MNWPIFINEMINTLFFTYSTNILVHLLTKNMKNCRTPKNPKMCDPILVTQLLKMQPHYSQSGSENATPSGCTFPSASYKEVSALGKQVPSGCSGQEDFLAGQVTVKASVILLQIVMVSPGTRLVKNHESLP